MNEKNTIKISRAYSILADLVNLTDKIKVDNRTADCYLVDKYNDIFVLMDDFEASLEDALLWAAVDHKYRGAEKRFLKRFIKRAYGGKIKNITKTRMYDSQEVFDSLRLIYAIGNMKIAKCADEKYFICALLAEFFLEMPFHSISKLIEYRESLF